MSDKVFKGNRGATGVFFMTLVTIATIIYWLNPAGNPTIDMLCMIVIGFLIYGPVMLIGLHALVFGTEKSGRYGGGFHWFIRLSWRVGGGQRDCRLHRRFSGWDGGFMVMIGGSILAAFLLIVVMTGERKHHAEVAAKRR